MAGHARFTALLDACVIHPVAVIDSLLSAAHLGLYAPKWTTRIEQEWMKPGGTDRQAGRQLPAPP